MKVLLLTSLKHIIDKNKILTIKADNILIAILFAKILLLHKKQQKAPTYAFAIGSYTIDRNGTLSGEKNEELTEALVAQGFTAA